MPQDVGKHKDETEDEGRSLWSKCFGLYMCYFGVYTRRGVRKGGSVRKLNQNSFWNKEYEAGFNSNRRIGGSGEYGLGVRTNRPSP